MHQRGQLIVDQSVGSARSLADTLALHKIWLEAHGQQGSRADRSDEKFFGAVLCGVNLERGDLRRTDFSRADLRNTKIRNADLSEAVLDSADLRGVDFSGAEFTDIQMCDCDAGPATKGFAEALIKVAKPDQSPHSRHAKVPGRREPETEFGPSR